MHVSFLNEIKMLLIVAPVKITVVKPTQSPPVTDIFGSTPATPPPEHTTNLTGNLTNSTTSTLVELRNSTTMNVSYFFCLLPQCDGSCSITWNRRPSVRVSVHTVHMAIILFIVHATPLKPLYEFCSFSVELTGTVKFIILHRYFD